MLHDVRSRSFLIAASAHNGVIGNQGAIPWHAPHDLQHFKRLTLGSSMIMGRATWDTLPRALPGRTSIVITSRPLTNPTAIVASTFEEAVEIAIDENSSKGIAFVGGSRIYQAALKLDWLTHLHLTKVHLAPAGDTFFPILGPE